MKRDSLLRKSTWPEHSLIEAQEKKKKKKELKQQLQRIMIKPQLHEANFWIIVFNTATPPFHWYKINNAAQVW